MRNPCVEPIIYQFMPMPLNVRAWV